MSDVCIYFNLFCKFVIQVQKLRKYIKIYQFSFNLSFSNCKRSKDSLEKKKLIFNFHVEYLFKKSNSEIPLSKIHPKFTGNTSDVNKENLYKWNFLSLVPSRSLQFSTKQNAICCWIKQPSGARRHEYSSPHHCDKCSRNLPTSGYLSAQYYEEGEEKDGRERRIREAARQIESSDKAACCIEAAELLILITQLGERLRGGKAHVINLRQQHRYQTYHHTNYTNQPHHIAHSRAPFHFHQHRLSNTPASPSSIRSGITWVLIKRNASHPLRTRLETWEKGGRGGCFWHRSWPTINIIYRRLNRPAASNRRL